MHKKLNILFIHSTWPNQFSLLHKHFRDTDTANSLFLISEQVRGHAQYEKDFPDGVISYHPDGEMDANSYYFSKSAEQKARHSLNILNAYKRLSETRTIDVIVAHTMLGGPYMLFDEIDAAIVSYIEFPSFRHHQWDARYPPQDAQRYYDKFDEMLNFFAAVKSDAVITPSLYAKTMFPAKLQDNVIVQMEGFDSAKMTVNEPDKVAFEKQSGCIYIGFCGSSLSSEKGLELFIIISQRLSRLNPNVRFVLIGASKGTGYGYESVFLDQHHPQMAFRDYLFDKYEVDRSLYISTERLEGVAFSSTIHAVDFFIYPLQYGSANWGVYELFLRGKIIVAGNRCFLPELITSGEDGFLVDYDDIEGWVRLCNHIARYPEDYKEIGRRAAHSGERFYIENVAKEYLEIFGRIADNKKLSKV